jgi:hypothetical protein
MNTTTLIFLSSLGLGACTGSKGGDDDSGGSEAVSEAGVEDSRAGCTYEHSLDEGADGSVEQTTHIEWDPRVDADGEWYVVEYQRTHVNGDFLDESLTYDDRLCQLSYEGRESADGEETGARSVSTCDTQGVLTERTLDGWVDGAWSAYSSTVWTNVYEDALLIDQTQVTTYEDPESGESYNRVVYTYEGDLLVLVTYYIGETEDDLYYTVEYEYDGNGDWIEATIVLGAYFGSDEGEVYSTTSLTRDERGNVLTRDEYVVLSSPSDSHDVFTWDDLDRPTGQETWSDSDGTHETHVATWDPDHYRRLTYAYADLMDPSADHTYSYDYDGPWPWSGTATMTYTEASLGGDTSTFAYDCP